MRMRHGLIAAALAAAVGGVVVPALAEAHGGAQTMPDQNTGMGRTNHETLGGMMSGGDMSGCMGMMRSMNNGGGPPNSQWRKRPPAERSMPN